MFSLSFCRKNKFLKIVYNSVIIKEKNNLTMKPNIEMWALLTSGRNSYFSQTKHSDWKLLSRVKQS